MPDKCGREWRVGGFHVSRLGLELGQQFSLVTIGSNHGSDPKDEPEKGKGPEGDHESTGEDAAHSQSQSLGAPAEVRLCLDPLCSPPGGRDPGAPVWKFGVSVSDRTFCDHEHSLGDHWITVFGHPR